MADKLPIRPACTGFRAPRHFSVFHACWFIAFLCCWPASSATLSVFSPVYSSCGDVSVNGVVLPSPGDTIIQVAWKWGDGSSNTSFFPATHEYSQNGTFTIQVTATSQAGETISASTTAMITSAADPVCGYEFWITPGTIVLRDGVTQLPVQLSLRDPSGAFLPVDVSNLTFTSSNPSLVQVDAQGIVSSNGFGQAVITAKHAKYPRSATAQAIAGHLRIEPAILVLSMAGPTTGQLSIDAAQADGTPLKLTSATVVWSGSNGIATVDSTGRVTALRAPITFGETPYMSAQVNGVSTHNSAVIRVLPDDWPITMDRITTTGAPQTVFYIADSLYGFNQRQIFADYDVARVTDLAYQIERNASGVFPNSGDLQYLVNDVAHIDGTNSCGLSGNPVRLGCLLLGSPDDAPYWDVFFHEMGHNFTLSSQRFSTFASAQANSPLYVEGLATAMSMYTGRHLRDFSNLYGLSQTTLNSILSPKIHFWWDGPTPSLDGYIAAGANYQTITADILDDMLMVLMKENGYVFFRRFLSIFLPVNVPYPFVIQSQSQQATFFVAALSAAIRTDLRGRFRTQWGFPVDDTYYASIYPFLLQYASHADTPPLPNTITPTASTIALSGATGTVMVLAPGACPWTGSSNSSWVTVTSGASGCGDGILTYSVAVNPGASQRNATLTVAGQVFSITQSGSPQISGELNAATSLPGGIAPNEFISICGQGLGPDAGGYSGPMTTLASGTRIYIGGTAAPITYSSASQVNALVPFGVAGTGATTIQAEYNGVKGNTVTVPVTESSPGIFTQGFGPGQAWVLNQDQTFNSASNPAPRGTYVAFWATGQGLVDIPQQDGNATTGPPFPKPLLPVNVSLGGVKMPDSNVVFTGLVYSGEIQVNVLIPDSAPTGAAVPFSLMIGDVSSRAGVTVAIK